MGCLGEDAVVGLVEDALSADDRAAARAHLAECEPCRELVAHAAQALMPTVGSGGSDREVEEGDGGATPLAAPEKLGPGAVVGRYRILSELGSGAMGVVYAAEQLGLRRKVALKVVRPSSEGGADMRQLRARLLREGRAASAVRHPHVVTVHDVLELDDGSPVMVMDLLEGESLRVRLARGRLTVRETAQLCRQLLSALESAHAAGVIHRDLKPDNIFLVDHGEDRLDACILDFGIAKLTAVEGIAAQTTGLTISGMLVGTPHYMAPEQAFAEPDLDGRVDLWAVGVIAYECLSGRRPCEGQSMGQLFRRLATLTTIPQLQDVAPEVPAPLARWVHGLLRERDRRVASASEARLALDEAVARGRDGRGALEDSAAGVALPSAPRPWRRGVLPFFALAGVVAVVLVLARGTTESEATTAESRPATTAAQPDHLAPTEPATSTEEPPPADPRPALEPTPSATPATIASARPPGPAPTARPHPAPAACALPRPTVSASNGPGKLLTVPPF